MQKRNLFKSILLLTYSLPGNLTQGNNITPYNYNQYNNTVLYGDNFNINETNQNLSVSADLSVEKSITNYENNEKRFLQDNNFSLDESFVGSNNTQLPPSLSPLDLSWDVVPVPTPTQIKTNNQQILKKVNGSGNINLAAAQTTTNPPKNTTSTNPPWNFVLSNITFGKNQSKSSQSSPPQPLSAVYQNDQFILQNININNSNDNYIIINIGKGP